MREFFVSKHELIPPATFEVHAIESNGTNRVTVNKDSIRFVGDQCLASALFGIAEALKQLGLGKTAVLVFNPDDEVELPHNFNIGGEE